MAEEIFEIKIINVAKMTETARDIVKKKVSDSTSAFKQNYRGFAKITYVTASPPRIKDIEPIEGTITDYYEKFSAEVGTTGDVF